MKTNLFKRTNDKGFDEILQIRMPFDLRNEDPNINYGVHGLEMFFILMKDNKAVQFMLVFRAMLPSVPKSTSALLNSMPDIDGWDLGYHAPEPRWEGQSESECHLLDGGKCYYDGSSLNGSELWKTIAERAVGNKDYDMVADIYLELKKYWDEVFNPELIGEDDES